MFKSDNTSRLLIGKDINRTAGVQVNDNSLATFIADGEVVVLGEDGTPLAPGSTFADSRYITIVQGRGGTGSTQPMTTSVKIDGSQIITASGVSFRDRVEQQSYIGLDDVAAVGSIDAQPFTNYKLTITYKNDKEVFSEQLLKRVYFYSTGSAATQLEIATYFANTINNEEFYGVQATVVNIGADYGIRLDGRPLEWKLPTFEWNVMDFEVSLGTGFGATTLTDPKTAADKGSGRGEQIAELEWFCQGFDGAINRVNFPAAAGRSDADSTASYDMLAIESFDVSEDYPVSGTKPAKALTYIAIPEPAVANQMTDVLAQLNPWLATVVRPQAALAV